MLLTNARALGRLVRSVNKLQESTDKLRKGRRTSTGKALCRKYINSKGKKAFAGTKALKLSQTLVKPQKLSG